MNFPNEIPHIKVNLSISIHHNPKDLNESKGNETLYKLDELYGESKHCEHNSYKCSQLIAS